MNMKQKTNLKLDQWGQYCHNLKQRKSVREFSTTRPELNIVLECLDVANTAPSGANLQPWHFTLLQDQRLKRIVREQAELVETEFYTKKASRQWLQDLSPFQTTPSKPFLEEAPYLIVVFYCPLIKYEGQEIRKSYFPIESTGIATGFLLASLHQAGLSTLTYTPKPCTFLNRLCSRPKSDRAYMTIVVGHGSNSETPKREKRPLIEKLSIY
jgi:iodotyrosine deiodinase